MGSPSTWPRVRLGDVAEHRLGKMLDKAKNTGLPRRYLRNPNIKWFEVDLTDLQEIRVEEHEVEKYRLWRGDVLICEGGEAGRAAIWDRDDTDIIFQKAIHRVRVSNDLDNRFLVHRLMYDYFTGGLDDYYTGATIKHFTGQDLARYSFPLPTIDEQRRIAAILDQADALRRCRRTSLKALSDLTTSTFLAMFGDPVLNPTKWEVKTLQEIADEKFNNGIFRKNHEYSASSVGTPIVWVEELFAEDSIDTSSSRRLQLSTSDADKYGLNYGDILFCRSSLRLEGIAYSNVYLGEKYCAAFECHLIRLTPDQKIISPVFLNYQLRLPSLRSELIQRAKTSTMTTIDQKALGSVKIIVPPLAQQRKFEEFIRGSTESRRTQRNHLAHLDTLFASLQHRAFRGEL
jgi:type I restriction enzyme S subunit